MLKHQKTEHQVTKKLEINDKISDDELSSFSDFSSGAELNSCTTDEFDGETIGSVTTDTDQSKNVKKPVILQVIEEKPTVTYENPADNQYKSLNIKKITPKKKSGNELADMVKRLTGNDFKNTTTTHASQRHNWVPMSKSSDEPPTSTSDSHGTSEEKITPAVKEMNTTKPELIEQEVPVKNSISVQIQSNISKKSSIPEFKTETIKQIEQVPEVVPSPIKQLDEIVITASLEPLVVEHKEKSSSSFDAKPKTTGFRSVRRPVMRKISDVSITDSESECMNRPTRPSLPVPRNYREIVMSKLAQRNRNKNLGKPPQVPVPNLSVTAPEINLEPTDIFSDGNQNTSDDAESIPISFRAEKCEESPVTLETVDEQEVLEPRLTHTGLIIQQSEEQILTDCEEVKTEKEISECEISVSEVSEVRQAELKQNIAAYQTTPTKSRKPLLKKISENIEKEKIIEEKSETSSSSSVKSNKSPKENTGNPPEKKKRKLKIKVEKIELSTEQKAEQLNREKKEYEEFVQKQKEAQKVIKEEKTRKKKTKKSKKIENVKVTNIFDNMADPDEVSSDSHMTLEAKRRNDRNKRYTVKLINRETWDNDGNPVKLNRLKGEDLQYTFS